MMTLTLRFHIKACLVLGLSGLLLGGCQLQPARKNLANTFTRSPRAALPAGFRPVVIEARRIEPAAPAPVAPVVPPLPKPVPTVARKPLRVSSGNPMQAIATANREARHAPDENGFENALMKYMSRPM